MLSACYKNAVRMLQDSCPDDVRIITKALECLTLNRKLCHIVTSCIPRKIGYGLLMIAVVLSCLAINDVRRMV